MLEMGLLTQAQVEKGRADADSTGEGVLDTLVAQKVVSPRAVTQAKAAQFGVETIDLNDIRLEDEVINSLPRHIAKKYKVVPIYRHGDRLTVALSDPSDLGTLDSLHHLLNLEIDPVVASEEEIEGAIARIYGASDDSVSKMIQDITEGEVDIGNIGQVDVGDDGAVVDADAPIIKLVNGLIVEAFKLRASDIHLEPLAKTFRVRYRIDGMLTEMKGPPKRLQASIVSRLKIQSNMSIAEHRIPQDGSLQLLDGLTSSDLLIPSTPAKAG